MERRGRAEAPVPRSDVSFRLDQKTANFKAAACSGPMQWSVLTEGKQKNQFAQTEFRFIKTIIIIRGGNYPTFFALTSALHCSKRRQTSRWPWRADRCSGVCCLKESKESTCAKRVSLHKNYNKNEGDSNYQASFASTSALNCSKRRHISRSPLSAEKCSGVL
jgi:hypothetical protein